MGESVDPGVFRILDANCNRLREALRVAEEHLRFVCNHPQASLCAKQLRHAVHKIVQALDPVLLNRARNTAGDVFAREVRPEETDRPTTASVCTANLKRGQEAARVIEEYGKLAGSEAAVSYAKEVRFGLYDLEKLFMEIQTNG